ncbi:MAG TPA: hypothetical protein VF846_14780, partial [Thermoanaerobaculia bacterium]
ERRTQNEELRKGRRVLARPASPAQLSSFFILRSAFYIHLSAFYIHLSHAAPSHGVSLSLPAYAFSPRILSRAGQAFAL